MLQLTKHRKYRVARPGIRQDERFEFFPISKVSGSFLVKPAASKVERRQFRQISQDTQATAVDLCIRKAEFLQQVQSGQVSYQIVVSNVRAPKLKFRQTPD